MVRRLNASHKPFGPCPFVKSDGTVCGTSLENKSKYERHLETHDPPKYECVFCGKKLKRPDVLNAHRKICTARGDQPIPGPLERGRKRHACNECSRLKVKCDEGMPCTACYDNGRTCVKPGHSSTGSPSPSLPADGNRNSINFLLNSPGEKDFLREFPKSNYMSPNNQHAQVANMLVTPYAFPPPDMAPGMANFQQFHPASEPSFATIMSGMTFDATYNKQTSWMLPMDSATPWTGTDERIRSIMEKRAMDVREGLKMTAHNYNIISQQGNAMEQFYDAIEIITADFIVHNIDLYFRNWHRHAPMVHQPTFNACNAALPLVLALMALGGMYSKDHGEVAKLKILLDVIETFVFNLQGSGLNLEYDSPERRYIRQGLDASEEWQQYQMEEAQGAYLFVVLQYWTGNSVARSRAREQRFARVIQIFHHLELTTIQHTPDEVIHDELSFRRWIRKESLIRLVTISTMLDNLFNIFNNVAPRFQWAELDLRFPSDDNYFRPANYDEYLQLGLLPQPPSKIKVKEAFMLLFAPLSSMTEYRKLQDASLTALDVQMLIYFLYSHLWNSAFNSPVLTLPGHSMQAFLTSFKAALANWKALWDEVQKLDSTNYSNTAENYYNSTREILAFFEKSNGVFPVIPTSCEKGAHLKILLNLSK